MAKKNRNSVVSSKTASSTGNGPIKTAAPVATAMRNSPIPKISAGAVQGFKKASLTQEQIAKRAYEIWQTGQGGSQDDNWYRALRELNGGQ